MTGRNRDRRPEVAMSFFELRLPPATLDVSIVIPVRAEAPNVAALAAEIDKAMTPAQWSWECLWVDDGSADETPAELARLSARSDRHRWLALDRGYGQSAALGVGFSRARGALVATMDGDGQNDPADLPALLALAFDAKLDVVNSYRAKSQFGWVRRASSRIANAFRNQLTGERVRDVGCSMRVIRRECLDGILVFQAMHRFLPTLVRLNGYERMAEVAVRHRPRLHGTSKYGIWNRLGIGIADTLAVRWLARRMTSPRVEGSSDAGEET
jgi:dolichol-phosphate mannosyltransferase